ncbi:Histone deacetylase complex subunit [Pleurostoma richardsiae]|uniref:Histone deacetylase complex subunit n=1 Tax=Pleurostoma richardsiae TaxID=41990 RepID=A0AA38RYU6_9PEZI|nr:Histone deacetylase complex subunit [Pleurostoma richardsiae]
MDAQNATEPASTKPTASPKRAATITTAIDSSTAKSAATAETHPASLISLNKPSPVATGSSSPTDKPKDPRPGSAAHDDDGSPDANSEAETIVLPGKDGSPIKSRKVIKHEDDSDRADKAGLSSKRKHSSGSRDDDKAERGNGAEPLAADAAAAQSVKRKKKLQDKQRAKDGSSGLSSAPASPPQRSRQRSDEARSDSELESGQARPSKDKARSSDKLVPTKRKAPKAESEDEVERRKARRQRAPGSSGDAVSSSKPQQHQQHKDRDLKSSSSRAHGELVSNTHRSVSPHPRTHRRSVSSQLPSQVSNGLSHKKKRVPAPLTTDYHSDESSAGGTPHMRSSKFRSLTTPATAESTISPAKVAPHKKHLDAHGQTFLARACARGEYEIAKQRLGERPEDLNVADFAGNTPLQIAALNGYEDIVKLLVDAGCNLDCVNYDKDTPLLDAVDNGHLGVVKILLDAGVNPRKANVNGEEPIDRVSDDLENGTEIKAALLEAKQRMGERRRTSEEHHDQDHTDSRSSHGPESPRESSAAPTSSHALASGRRAGTVRSTKTSNHLLYMPMDDKTLRQAAGRGDEETVTRILQVRDTFDDPESMVAAARGGHDIVMQLLLALGSANPDPGPVSSMPPEYATPMLAAIGQENIKVIRLLLDQNNFDPTRRFKGDTYYEIARKRQGTNWKEEEHMLKEAYDAYRRTHKDSSKTRSPSRREQERDVRRGARAESKDDSSRSHRRKGSSPTRDGRRTSSSKVSSSPKEKRRSGSFTGAKDDQTSPKRGPGRPRKDERMPTIAVSDRETSPKTTVKHASKAPRADLDLALSSEGETLKPRRKLVSGKALKGEREKQRRASMVSNASSMREAASPRESRPDETVDRPKAEKYHDRTKALKRDDSRDRLSVSGENTTKRHRASATPPHGSSEREAEGPVKRRRLDVDGKEKRRKLSPSPDDRHRKSGLARDGQTPQRSLSKSSHKNREESERREPSKAKKGEATVDHSRKDSGRSAASDKSIHVKSEDTDLEMRDANQSLDGDDAAGRALRENEEEKKQAEVIAKALEAKKRQEEDEKRRAEEEKRRREEEEEIKRREEEQRKILEAEKKRREEEEAEKRRLQEEEEKKRREEEERRKREEEERKRLEEEEERRKREEEEKRWREEEERKRQEEERLRKEQLEREAEEARRKREEEERKEQERKERLLREEMERRRAAREAEQRRIFLEQERIRLSKLPPLLRWLDGCPNPKTSDVAEKFSMMQGVRYDCIRPETNGTDDGREQWLLNTQVALLLGEKDLKLSRYTGWEHIPASMIAKKVIWRLESDRYALTTPSLYDIGKQLPDYYCGEDPDTMSYRVIERLRGEAWEKFAAMDMFFVKASELMFIIPNIQHLRRVKLSVAYRELPEHEYQLAGWAPLQKWKNDPDAHRFHGFAPRNKYYINGQMIYEERPGLAAVSKTPFPEKRVPRRGFVAVPPHDPDYTRLCKEQGLDHLLSGLQTPPLVNGLHSSPTSEFSLRPPPVHDISPAQSEPPTANGDSNHTISTPASVVQEQLLTDGVDVTANDDK